MVDVLIFSFPHKIISIVRKRHLRVSFFVGEVLIDKV
nr:MAG TPA: hypothetical protein [Caudoviricetes sp.]DAV68897.1 MAG TPA: hypothetical protein [Caudoviricetes sp.]